MIKHEIWLPVVGFEGAYEVSNLGRVRSLARVLQQKSRKGKLYQRNVSPRILRPGTKTSGHVSVVLGREGGSHDIHVLVLEAFVGPCPLGMECRHKDSNPSHNRLSNLEWATRGDNTRDKKWQTVLPKNYKLTGEQAKEIKSRLRQKFHGIGILLAREYGVTPSAISAIKKGRVHVDA